MPETKTLFPDLDGSHSNKQKQQHFLTADVLIETPLRLRNYLYHHYCVSYFMMYHRAKAR